MRAAAVVAVVAVVAGQRRGGNRESSSLIWRYGDVFLWPWQFPDQCDGRAQSPIDVVTADTALAFPAPLLVFHGYEQRPARQVVMNNGHTVTALFEWPAPVFLGGSSDGSLPEMVIGGAPFLSGGPLLFPEDEYVVEQYHLHWGSDDLRGSEHTVNGVRCPLELHMVHYNRKYGSLSKALLHPDGLVVLAVHFTVTDASNRYLDPVIGSLRRIKYAGNVTQTPPAHRLSSLLPLPSARRAYYTYRGSLTTPLCQETVTWVLFRDTLHVGRRQLQQLRRLKDLDRRPLVNNFRPPQRLNHRVVRRSFEFSRWRPVNSPI